MRPVNNTNAAYDLGLKAGLQRGLEIPVKLTRDEIERLYEYMLMFPGEDIFEVVRKPDSNNVRLCDRPETMINITNKQWQIQTN